jgi:hypothetical protein
VKLTDFSDSEYARTSAPSFPWMLTAAIHQSDTPAASTPIRSAAANARRHATCRSSAATTNHNTGPGMIIMIVRAIDGADADDDEGGERRAASPRGGPRLSSCRPASPGRPTAGAWLRSDT